MPELVCVPAVEQKVQVDEKDQSKMIQISVHQFTVIKIPRESLLLPYGCSFPRIEVSGKARLKLVETGKAN